MTFDVAVQSQWRDSVSDIPTQIDEIPGMVAWWERRLFYWLARYRYTAEGKICDLGAYLGSSTICFALGLRAAGRRGKIIYSYDLFQLGPFEQSLFPGELPPNNETLPIFMNNLRDYLDLIEVRTGNIESHRWTDGPIEILFVDLAKSARTWDHVVREFFPHLIPGKSIVILQDYLWHESGAWHHVVMEKLERYFDDVIDPVSTSVVFLHSRPFEDGVLEAAMWDAIPSDEKVELMDRAIERMDTEERRGVLLEIRQSLVG